MYRIARMSRIARYRLPHCAVSFPASRGVKPASRGVKPTSHGILQSRIARCPSNPHRAVSLNPASRGRLFTPVSRGLYTLHRANTTFIMHRTSPAPQSARSRYSSDVPRNTRVPRGERSARGATESSSSSFPSSAAIATSACAICLGRHLHRPMECRATTLHYHPSQPTLVKRPAAGRGIVLCTTNDPVCLRFNLPRRCDGCNLPHKCSGCGSPAHCAQDCHLSREGSSSNSA